MEALTPIQNINETNEQGKPAKSLYLMAALYVAAGVYHFVSPQFYYAIMPPYIPFPYACIYISGVAEALLGVLLLNSKTRYLAVWGIIALLIAVFPANMQMLINYIHEDNPRIWVAALRLPLQIPLIWWAWSFLPKRKANKKRFENSHIQ